MMTQSALLESAVAFLVFGTLASYLGGSLFKERERLISGWIATLATAGSLVYFALLFPSLQAGSAQVALFGFIPWRVDLLGWIVATVGVVLALVVNLYSIRYMEEDTGNSKFFPLILLMVLAVVGLAFAADLFHLYLFFELLAISSFPLVAFRKDEPKPVEAGLKFLVASATGSAMVLLGIALVYQGFGTLDLVQLSTLVVGGPSLFLWLPLGLFTVGFGIKAALFPLHTWLPDAHPEAPSGISAMLSGIVIEAGLFALLRVYFTIGGPLPWPDLLIWFALLTMTAGNLMALTQKQMKRMLAYSSIAQMGYILLGVGITASLGAPAGAPGGLFHIVTHAFMKGLAFLCAGALIFRLGSGETADMRGAAWKMPLTAAAFTVAVLSLAGVPPFAGFMSKLLIYQSGIQSATTLGWVASLIAIANSVLSLGYYLPAVGVLYSKERSPLVAAKAKEVPFLMAAALVILVVLIVYLGISPDPVRQWAFQAFALLKGGF
jgi:proton-translocating NADH-quinone oxidoreductase chain N